MIRRMCDVIGLKDIHVKRRGATTPMSVINCFLRALQEVETSQVIHSRSYL